MGKEIKLPAGPFALTPEAKAFFRAVGRMGGLTSSANMTKAERVARARKAAAAREAKRKAKAKG